MKITRVGTLVLLAAAGVGGAVLLEWLLVASGKPILNPPYSFGITLAGVAAVLVALALPIRRAVTDRAKPIDPFYAMRVLVLAKASALVGAAFLGGGIGLLGWILTRPVLGVGSVPQAVVTLVGAGLLLSAGYIAELLCRIPPGDDPDDTTTVPAEKG